MKKAYLIQIRGQEPVISTSIQQAAEHTGVNKFKIYRNGYKWDKDGIQINEIEVIKPSKKKISFKKRF